MSWAGVSKLDFNLTAQKLSFYFISSVGMALALPCFPISLSMNFLPVIPPFYCFFFAPAYIKGLSYGLDYHKIRLRIIVKMN
jgi:hypothetical protein